MSGTDTLGEQKVNGRCLTMNEPTVERLEMRWLPVIDAGGHTRMEATWALVPAAGAAEPAHAVTHAA
jgi:hypothetical protein